MFFLAQEMQSGIAFFCSFGPGGQIPGPGIRPGRLKSRPVEGRPPEKPLPAVGSEVRGKRSDERGKTHSARMGGKRKEKGKGLYEGITPKM